MFVRSLLFAVLVPLAGATPAHPEATVRSAARRAVSAGVLRGHVRWTNDAVWSLTGDVRLADGATLDIEPGTRIEAVAGSRVVVDRTSRIVAEGTLLQPIVFTCQAGVTPYPGCWGGVVIQGHAPINIGQASSPAARGVGAAGCREVVSPEVGGLFGGCDAADSSGVLRFVRIEYAQKEGLRLEGVGQRTVLDYIQINRGLDVGLRVVGGTADLSHLVLTANGGTGLAWTSGWTGRGQYLVLQLDLQNGLAGLSGIVGENGDGTAQEALPRSAPQLWNVTLLAVPVLQQGVQPAAITLRKGTAGSLRNLLVSKAPVGLSIADAATCAQVANGSVVIQHAVFSGVSALGDPDPDPAPCGAFMSPDVERQLLLAAGPEINRVVVSADSVEALAKFVNGIELVDARPTTLLAGATPPAGPFFDNTAAFVGGVRPIGFLSSSIEIPWHSGWTAPAPVPPATPPGTVLGVVASGQQSLASGIRVSANAFTSFVTTGAGGAFQLPALAGPATLASAQLPADCRVPQSPSIFVPTGDTVRVALLATCGPAAGVIEVSAGLEHTCAIDGAGQASCWGQNQYGQLGDGTRTARSTRTALSGAPVLATLGQSSLYSACGLATSGRMQCWGFNSGGQLGDGTFGAAYHRSFAAPVQSTLAFKALSVGGYPTCGLVLDGAAWCWGEYLGNGTTDYSTTPVPVAGGHRFVQLTAGLAHTCGLTETGAAWCWGNNGVAQLGDGTTQNRTSPVAVAGGLTFVQLAAGREHTCGLTAAGAAHCWGVNAFGQLGDGGTALLRFSPFPVQGGLVFRSLEAGTYHTCGVTTSGSAACWGYNELGQLGDGTTTDANVPVVLPGLTFARISAGGYHTCGVGTDGSLRCWGANESGQLGLGGLAPPIVSSPAVVPW